MFFTLILAAGAFAMSSTTGHADSWDDQTQVQKRTETQAPRRKVNRRLASEPAKVRTETHTRDIPQLRDQSGTGFALFLGAGGGVINLSGNETSKSGSAMLGKATFSVYSRSAVLDLGLGWMQSKLNGTETTTTSTTSTTTDSAVQTRAAMVEFSPRLRLGKTFEIGPTGSVLFGTNASFSDSTGVSGAPVFVGAKGGAGWDLGDYQLRAMVSAATSLTIPDRHANMVFATLEIGIPFLSGKTVVRERETQITRDNYQREIVETQTTVVQKVDVIKEVVLFSFDDQVVHFEFDRANLVPNSREFVNKLGQYLASNPSLWGSVRVEGHTDSRGSEEYNQALSDRRAETIVNALASAGVPRDRLNSKGYGKTRPIDSRDNDVSQARNRRVEMSFVDVQDSKILRDNINRIRFETVRPSTCVGDSCR